MKRAEVYPIRACMCMCPVECFVEREGFDFYQHKHRHSDGNAIAGAERLVCPLHCSAGEGNGVTADLQTNSETVA